MIFFFHMTQILLPADKRINFIPIKQNGNCHTTMAIDILRNSKSEKKPTKAIFSTIGKLVVQKFNKQINMQACDMLLLCKNIMSLWPQESLQPSWFLKGQMAFNHY